MRSPSMWGLAISQGCAVVIVIVNWIGDRILTPDAVRAGKRRGVVVVCLILTAGGMAIPYVGSIGAVVALTILPVEVNRRRLVGARTQP